MLFSIPRNDAEASSQIPENIETIMEFRPNIIGLVSPSDAPGRDIRTRMWDKFATKLQDLGLTNLVMQHFPHTSMGSIGKISGTKVTIDDLNRRLEIIRSKGITNVLALKGWEQNDNYLKPNEVAANQPEYLFKSVPEWITYLKPQFDGISATTYIEGHPFRRRRINWDKNTGKNWHAVKTEYNASGKSYEAGILKSNLIAGILYDIEKIKAGATKIFCAHVFDANLFIRYKAMFEEMAGALNGTYELIPEISVGASKRSFYNDTLLSSTYCTDEFQDAIFKSGENIFSAGMAVKVIGKGEELTVAFQRRNEYPGTILRKRDDCPGLICYDIEYSDKTIEEKVPISRITTAEVDDIIVRLWINNCKRQVQILKENNNRSIYIISIDMDATKTFMRECLAEGLLQPSPHLYPGESTSAAISAAAINTVAASAAPGAGAGAGGARLSSRRALSHTMKHRN
jgi:hypothetical protein